MVIGRIAIMRGTVRPVFFLNPFGWGPGAGGWPRKRRGSPGTDSFLKGLILAQNERWRRGLGMQVEREPSQCGDSGERESNAWVTYPRVGDSRGKLRVIPSDVRGGHPLRTKGPTSWDGPSWY